MPEQLTNPFDKSLVLEIQMSRLGVRRKVDAKRMRLDADMESSLSDGVSQPDSDILHVAKDLIDCKEYRDIVHLDNDMRIWLSKRAMPSILRRGAFMIGLTAIEAVDRRVDEYIETRGELVSLFLDVYPDACKKGMAKQGDLADVSEYPDIDDVRKAFAVKRRYVSFSVPEALQTVSGTMYERESKRLRAEAQNAAEEIRAALRKMFLDLVSHMQERLTPNPDGSRKTFRGSMLKNFGDFMASFESRNLTDDDALKALISQARELLAGTDAKYLRNDSGTADHIAQGMAAIKDSLDGMLGTAPVRKFAWSKEQAPATAEAEQEEMGFPDE